MSAHVIVTPPLKSSAGVMSVLAVNLNQLVEDAACQVQILIPEVVAQEKEDLLDSILVLVVPGYVSTVSDKHVPALCFVRQIQENQSIECLMCRLTIFIKVSRAHGHGVIPGMAVPGPGTR